MSTYCIDTSALIDGWKDYPLENFGSVWEKVKELITDNRITSPYHVLDELEVGGDDLYAWCKDNYFFCSPTTKTGMLHKEIKTNFPGFIPKKTPKIDWADPYVIAIAIENDYSVISHETRRDKINNEKTFYIPDICDNYGIKHISFLDLIKVESWKF